jgi:hypothetical protein
MALDAFDLALAEASEQGSQMWTDIRAGRFTASEMFRLIKSGTRDMTPAELKARPKSGIGSSSKKIEDPRCLSPDTKSYIYEKVAETLTGIAKQKVFSFATAHGEELEPIAAEEFSKRNGGFEYEILSFVPYGDHAGGSPDRKIKDRNEIVEIKAPYNSVNQVSYLMLTDQWDLKREFPDYYWQCQSNLLFTKTDLCHFVTYDYRMKDPKHQIVHIEVKPIAEDLELLGIKLGAAIKEKEAILNLLK